MSERMSCYFIEGKVSLDEAKEQFDSELCVPCEFFHICEKMKRERINLKEEGK